MVEEELETRVLKEVNIPFIVVERGMKQGPFGRYLICSSENIKGNFELDVEYFRHCENVTENEYVLENQQVMQKYDKNENPIGALFVNNPSVLYLK